MKTWHNTDKADWPRGPWDDEPAKGQWIDADTDLDCLIVRNPMGALCGYVGVPPGHPLHGVGYNACRGLASCDGDPIVCSCRLDLELNVHGGLTFSDSCQTHDDPARGVCHVPEPGRPADVWWLGFDCAHAGDMVPRMDYTIDVDSRYRDWRYVEREVTNLARQVAETEAQEA